MVLHAGLGVLRPAPAPAPRHRGLDVEVAVVAPAPAPAPAVPAPVLAVAVGGPVAAVVVSVVVMVSVEEVGQEKYRILEDKDVGEGVVCTVGSEIFAHTHQQHRKIHQVDRKHVPYWPEFEVSSPIPLNKG